MPADQLEAKQRVIKNCYPEHCSTEPETMSDKERSMYIKFYLKPDELQLLN